MNDTQNIINIIKGKIENELDENFINGFVNELKKTEENKLSLDSHEPKLQFDNSHISNNISIFINQYSPLSQGDISTNIKIFISKSLYLFRGLKYISEMSESNQIKQEIYSYLYNIIKEIDLNNMSKYEILFPYFYFLSNLDILDNELLGLTSLKKINFQDQLIKCLKINNFENNINNHEWIINFMVNPLNLIHYLEFILITCEDYLRYQGIQTSSYIIVKNNPKISNKNIKDFNNNNNFPKLFDILLLMEKSIKLIFFYFKLSVKIYNKYNLSILDLIISNILKSFISFSLEIIINNPDKIDAPIISNFLIDYLYASLDLEVIPNLSNELYIFGLMASLITSLKYSSKFVLRDIFAYIDCYNISRETNGKITKSNFISNNDTIILLNLLNCQNYYLFKKYRKGLNNCENSLKLVNTDDFILTDYFIFPSAYDIINKTNKNLKEKIYWNYGEICNYIINKKLRFPKIFKGTILLHLINIPDEKALLHNLIQYYYENKKFYKAIVLCEKVLSDLKYISIEDVNQNNFIERVSQINFDIYNIVMLIYIKIKIMQKKYNEAKQLSILNYERLTNQNTKILGYHIEKTYLYKTYTYLGYSLFKLGLTSDQNEERKKYFEQAKFYFEQANLKQISNNINNNNNFESSNVNSQNSFINQKNNDYKYYELCTMIYLGKFEEIENFFQSKIMNSNSNIHYNIKYNNIDEEIKFISLHIINLIGLLQYDKAYQMAKEAIKFYCNKNSNYLYQIYLEYFYIGIYREFIYLDDKNNKFSSGFKSRTEKIATELIDVLKIIIQLLDIKKKKLENEKQNGENSKNSNLNNSILGNSSKDIQDELIKIYHKDFEANDLRFSFNKYSKGQINFNIYLINSMIIKAIKMFSLLCLNLIKIPNIQEFDHINILKSQLTEIIEKEFDDSSLYSTLNGSEEDAFNNEILFINSIKSMINSNNNNLNKESNIEENLKQVIIHDSTNLEAMKLLIKQLFNKNDLSNVYVFCNKALKINDKEMGMWSLMADYYYLNKDEIKYYECSMKELKNSSKHRNSFLNDILDITI